MNLSEKSCMSCRADVLPLILSEAEILLQKTPGWQLLGNGARLERRFVFKNFAEALAFVNQVGDVAERQAHHPNISFGWGYASVLLYTHKIDGLHENDFIMAAKINELYGGD